MPSAQEQMGTWKVKEDKDWPASLRQAPGPQSLFDLLQSLRDDSWAEKTRSKFDPDAPPTLKSQREVCCNVIWRFLQLRGYLNDKHQLTSWGEVLATIMAELGKDEDTEELAIVAVEMMRFNAWNGNDLAKTTPGRSFCPLAQTLADYGVDRKEASTINLITRVACLGRFKHKSKGYSGPLDRELLSFAWMISAVRSSLRDLIETTLVCMFLNGDAVRERNDWTVLAQT